MSRKKKKKKEPKYVEVDIFATNRHLCDKDMCYVSMMKHDRVHKKGTGSRERVNAVTDYECSKNPLHDFRRSRYVQWN